MEWKKIFIYGIEFFFGLNVVLVDMWLYTQTHPSPLPQAPKPAVSIATPTPSPTPDSSLTPTTIPSSEPAAPVIVKTTTPVKEFFIPLGSGQTDTTDWTDISGALGYIDSTAYTKLKKVVLEATVTIPNGNGTAWIRLFDKTDSHPVWFSETSWSGGNTQFIISQPITLDTGNKLYQIQVKNQLPSMAIVNNARIHITLQ